VITKVTRKNTITFSGQVIDGKEFSSSFLPLQGEQSDPIGNDGNKEIVTLQTAA
jgi:hypothetical protein